jgi:N-acetylglucosaminyl-diphospho-decaprenol L-rhamnosyltransferase
VATVRVGVLIVGYGHGVTIGALLETLGPTSGCNQGEVVIWDQPRPEIGHDPDLPRIVESARRRWDDTGWSVRVVQSTLNLGYGRGLNAAESLLSASVTWIAVLNPDTEIPSGALGFWLQLSQDLAATPGKRVGLTAPVLLNANGRTQRSHYTFPQFLSYWPNHSILGGALKQAWKRLPASRLQPAHRNASEQHKSRHVGWAMGAAWLVPRVAWQEIGGFDPDYFLYAEDMDFCWRLQAVGREVLALPGVTILHHQGEPAGPQRGRQQILLFQGLRLFLRKTQPALRRSSVLFSIALDMVLRLFLFTLPGMLPGATGRKARTRWWASAVTLAQTLAGS